ncbi:MAG TPA: hypothetical protein VGB95_00380 [Chitinophagales bacterium]
MKKVFYTAAIAVLTLAVGCKKDDNSMNSGDTYYLSAKVNGTSVSYNTTNTTDLIADYDPAANPGAAPTLQIVAQDANGGFTFFIGDGYVGDTYLQGSSYNGIGSYNMPQDSVLSACYYNVQSVDWATIYGTQYTGNVTITSDANNVVEGTFSFDGVGNDATASVKHITEGKFRLPRQ